MYKTRSFLTLLLGMSSYSFAQDYLNVADYSNKTTSFDLANVRKITFSTGSDMIVVKKDGSLDANFALNNVKVITFGQSPTGIQDVYLSNAVYAFPNPVIDQLYLSGQEQRKTTQVSIVDNLGSMVKKQVLNGAIDVSDLDAGLYICIFQNGSETVKVKFIKN